jgi:hypothetical protein
MIKLWDATRLNTDARPILDRHGQRCFAAAIKATCHEGDARNRTATDVLPKNLRSAVKHLSDGELDLMNAATLEEISAEAKCRQALKQIYNP